MFEKPVKKKYQSGAEKRKKQLKQQNKRDEFKKTQTCSNLDLIANQRKLNLLQVRHLNTL